MADESLKAVADRWHTRHYEEKSLEKEYSRVRDQLEALRKMKEHDEKVLSSGVGPNIRTRAYVVGCDVVFVAYERGVCLVKAETK